MDIRLLKDDGTEFSVKAEDLIQNPLPRPLRVVKASFRIHKGVLYYFKSLEFTGLKLIPNKTARSYFFETETLFSTKRARAYTPDRLRHGLSSLTDILERQGYQDAKVGANTLRQDDQTGEMDVKVTVQEGAKYMIRSVREEFVGTTGSNLNQTLNPNRPYSRIWLQDFVLGIKTNQYHLGFPDTSVEIQTLPPTDPGGDTNKDLVATVKPGTQVRVGAVEFFGTNRTSPRLLRRSVRIKRGELLDPTRTEQGRYRLARLGVFDEVDLNYQPEDEHTRDVIYKLQEGKRINVSLLFGWGSYELLRGGVELEVNNLWDQAHHLEVRAIQSFKASSGDLTYTVPELVGNDIDLFLTASGLRREEVDFTRIEYGGGLGLHKYFQAASTDVSTRYTYQILSASDFSSVQEVSSEGLTNPAVGSITIEIKHDRRDNPLYPRNGYKVFLTLETATRYLGGDANYQRIEIAPSWHHPIGGGLFLSLGFSHGIVDSFGSPANNLPFNKRFFPGGVKLFSVGGGLRWRTLIGPIRLEYGYNLNPRPLDPKGTLQFSLGFPF
jgi:outer membrane protein assembly factor BamA